MTARAGPAFPESSALSWTNDQFRPPLRSEQKSALTHSRPKTRSNQATNRTPGAAAITNRPLEPRASLGFPSSTRPAEGTLGNLFDQVRRWFQFASSCGGTRNRRSQVRILRVAVSQHPAQAFFKGVFAADADHGVLLRHRSVHRAPPTSAPIVLPPAKGDSTQPDALDPPPMEHQKPASTPIRALDDEKLSVDGKLIITK